MLCACLCTLRALHVGWPIIVFRKELANRNMWPDATVSDGSAHLPSRMTDNTLCMRVWLCVFACVRLCVNTKQIDVHTSEERETQVMALQKKKLLPDYCLCGR